jgi:hypothetical protein
LFAVPRTDGENVHASHAQNTHDGDLGLPLHVQLVHKEDWQDTDCEITQRRKGTVDVGHDDNDIDANAVSGDTGVHGNPGPEVCQRLALQQHQEHKDQSSNDGQDHDGVKNPDMKALDGDAH